jgi:hypothetical protein
MQTQFQQHQEAQQMILEGIRQQKEAQRQQMIQHQMMTTQMFTFMYGYLGQLFQQSGLQLPHFPMTQQLHADPTAPLPADGGFVNIPIASFPPSVTTPSDRDVCGTSDDDSSVSGSFYFP